MYAYNFALDLDGQNLSALQRKKKKLNELLDKYGESREAIDQHSSPEDWMEYQFAQGDQYINEVIEERKKIRQNPQLLNQLQTQDMAKTQKKTTSSTLEDVDKELDTSDLNISEERKERLKQLDYNNQLAVVRALREKQELENYQSHPSAEALKREASALHKAMQSKTEQEPKEQTNQQSDEKEQTTTLKEYKESSKFNQLIGSVFQEEGGYEDNLKKIDQPTNMGIIQSTLDNFNKAHPHLKIDKKLKDISKEDAELIYKLDYYDQYHLESIENNDNSKVLLHMFIMLKPSTVLTLLHQSLNKFGYPSQKLLVKEMIPTLNKIEKDNKSSDFKEILKSNFLQYLKNNPDAHKYKGWFSRIERL